MKPVFIIMIIFSSCSLLRAQDTTTDTLLTRMTDSVNYLLRNSEDAIVQPVFSINTKGDITLLDAQKSGFRFNIFSLGGYENYDSSVNEETGIVFVPENSKSITTNKFIFFSDKKRGTVGLFKFTRTNDTYVKSIHAILLRIRSYLITKYKPE